MTFSVAIRSPSYQCIKNKQTYLISLLSYQQALKSAFSNKMSFSGKHMNNTKMYF